MEKIYKKYGKWGMVVLLPILFIGICISVPAYGYVTGIELIKPINISKINDFRTKMEFVRKYIKKMIVTRGEDPHTTYITFTYTRPTIIARCEYLYIHLNQNLLVYRINEDETKDLIYENDCRYKKNKITGKFEK